MAGLAPGRGTVPGVCSGPLSRELYLQASPRRGPVVAARGVSESVLR